MAIYLPDVGGGPNIGEIQRQLRERREGRDKYVVDLDHKCFGLPHGLARQFMANLDGASIPYERRSKRDTDAAWLELDQEAMYLNYSLELERVRRGYVVSAHPSIREGVTRVAVNSWDRNPFKAQATSIEEAARTVLQMLKSSATSNEQE